MDSTRSTHGSSAQSHKHRASSTFPSNTRTASNISLLRTNSHKSYNVSHLHHNNLNDVEYSNNDDTRGHRHHHHRHLGIDTSLFDRTSSKSPHREGHKRSTSYDPRLSRTMSHLATSAGAKSLLSSRSAGKEKDRDAEDRLLRPGTNEMTESRYIIESPGGLGNSKKSTLVSDGELNLRTVPVRQRGVRSVQDLEQVKRMRKQGEQSVFLPYGLQMNLH